MRPHPRSLGPVALLTAVAALAVPAAVASGAGPDGRSEARAKLTIPAGFDLFETDPEGTIFRFRGKMAIPEGFFDNGSQAFEGDVPFGGVPIGRFRKRDAGSADTVLQRKSAVTVPRDGTPSKPVATELVQLSLASAAPIEVKVGDQIQIWEARAQISPSRRSTGRITIARTGERRGTFDHSLAIYPKFTFTRLDDGQTRELDVGALPDGRRPDGPFTARRAPWLLGCARHALTSAQPTKDFCAGLKKLGSKLKTKVVELQSSIFGGLLQIAGQPPLAHFACYGIAQPAPQSHEVKLFDEFDGPRFVRVTVASRLCNPASKNGVAIVNSEEHLVCYAIENGEDQHAFRFARDQFQLFFAFVREPVQLCLPSSKRPSPGPMPPTIDPFKTEHFRCYRVDAQPAGFLTPFGFSKPFLTWPANLQDQFGQYSRTVSKPSHLCSPVRKNAHLVSHWLQHLVCYPLADEAVSRRVSVRNQFGVETLTTDRLSELCQPAFAY